MLTDSGDEDVDIFWGSCYSARCTDSVVPFSSALEKILEATCSSRGSHKVKEDCPVCPGLSIATDDFSLCECSDSGVDVFMQASLSLPDLSTECHG